MNNLCKRFVHLIDLEIKLHDGSQLANIAANCVHVRRSTLFIVNEPPTLADVITIARSWSALEMMFIVCNTLLVKGTLLTLLTHCLRLQSFRKVQPGIRSWLAYKYPVREMHSSRDVSHLSCVYVDALHEHELVYIAQQCRNMRSLSIARTANSALSQGCAEFALQHIASSTIATLCLQNSANFAGAHLQSLNTLRDLQLRSMGSVSLLTDGDIISLARRSRSLVALVIETCPGITHSVVLPVLDSCPSLRHFTFHTKPLTERVNSPPLANALLEQAVRKLYPQLRTLRITY